MVLRYPEGSKAYFSGVVARRRLGHHPRPLDLTPGIATEAARLRARFGLRSPDAIHAATALAAGAGHLVTNDRDFLKIEPGVEVLLLE